MTQRRDQHPLATVTTATPQSRPDRPKLEVSATTITTGVVASMASALLGSSLGVAGTLVGAALGAAAYAVVAALYTHSVAAATYRVRAIRARTGRGTWSPGADAATAADIGDEGAATSVLEPVAAAEVSVRPQRGTTPEAPARGWNWRAVLAGALGAAVAFALALVLVTGLESVKGGQASGGLAVTGGSSQGGAGARAGDTTSAVTTTATSTATETATETATSTATETATSTATSTETSTETATSTERAVVTTTGSPQPSTPTGAAASSDSAAAATTQSTATTPVAPAGAGDAAAAP